jgi:hypothetical protein
VSQLGVVRTVPRFIEAVLGIQGSLIQKGEEQDTPTVSWTAVVIDEIRGWERAELVVVIVERQADLFQVVLALRPQAGFTRSLDRWQKQSDRDAADNQGRDAPKNDLHDCPPVSKQRNAAK